MRRSAFSHAGRRRHALVPGALLCAFGLIACGPSSPASPRPPAAATPPATPSPASQPTPAAPAVAAPSAATPGEVAAAETWDAAGITLERLPGNAIRVRGTDRWGARIDTTYADATYFANAVPVFARGLRDDQARAVTELIPRVRAATGSPEAPAQAPSPAP